MIAIIDDNDSVRHAIVRLLESQGYDVVTFASGEAFLAACPERFSCALLDMHMPGASGLDVLRALGEVDVAPAMVMLTGRADLSLAVAAMKLGAVDFLEKPCASETLLHAVESAPDRHARSRLTQTISREARDLVGALPKRQRQILAGIVAGSLNKTIAWELGLSIRTVEAYRAQLFRNLNAGSTAAAVRIALAAGIDGGGTPRGSRGSRESTSHGGFGSSSVHMPGW